MASGEERKASRFTLQHLFPIPQGGREVASNTFYLIDVTTIKRMYQELNVFPQEVAGAHALALAMDCVTDALRQVPLRAPWEQVEAAVRYRAARMEATSYPLPEPIQHALDREINNLLIELCPTDR